MVWSKNFKKHVFEFTTSMKPICILTLQSMHLHSTRWCKKSKLINEPYKNHRFQNKSQVVKWKSVIVWIAAVKQ